MRYQDWISRIDDVWDLESWESLEFSSILSLFSVNGSVTSSFLNSSVCSEMEWLKFYKSLTYKKLESFGWEFKLSKSLFTLIFLCFSWLLNSPCFIEGLAIVASRLKFCFLLFTSNFSALRLILNPGFERLPNLFLSFPLKSGTNSDFLLWIFRLVFLKFESLLSFKNEAFLFIFDFFLMDSP